MASGKPLEHRDALISDCGRYRYLLTRTWNVDRPKLLYVMLNPSTADADIDDPTIRRCRSIARDRHFGGIEVVNLYAMRATNPRELMEADFDPVGPANDLQTRAAAARADSIICAWGARKEAFRRAALVWPVLERAAASVFALTLNADGSPKHPLYVRSDVQPVPYRARPRDAAK